MTIRQLADREGISKAGARHILKQLGMLDQLERDNSGVLQVTDEQAAAVHAYRHRKAEPETSPGTDQQMESSGRTVAAASYRQAADTDGQAAAGADRQTESTDLTARLLVLLESDLAVLRDQLAAKDEEILALKQQLDAARLRIDQLTNAALNLAGKPLLEQENKSRFRRVLDALKGR